MLSNCIPVVPDGSGSSVEPMEVDSTDCTTSVAVEPKLCSPNPEKSLPVAKADDNVDVTDDNPDVTTSDLEIPSSSGTEEKTTLVSGNENSSTSLTSLNDCNEVDVQVTNLTKCINTDLTTKKDTNLPSSIPDPETSTFNRLIKAHSTKSLALKIKESHMLTAKQDPAQYCTFDFLASEPSSGKSIKSKGILLKDIMEANDSEDSLDADEGCIRSKYIQAKQLANNECSKDVNSQIEKETCITNSTAKENCKPLSPLCKSAEETSTFSSLNLADSPFMEDSLEICSSEENTSVAKIIKTLEKDEDSDDDNTKDGFATGSPVVESENNEISNAAPSTEENSTTYLDSETGHFSSIQKENKLNDEITDDTSFNHSDPYPDHEMSELPKSGSISDTKSTISKDADDSKEADVDISSAEVGELISSESNDSYSSPKMNTKEDTEKLMDVQIETEENKVTSLIDFADDSETLSCTEEPKLIAGSVKNKTSEFINGAKPGA
jgi:hypothetical protein